MSYLNKPSLTLGYAGELSINPSELFDLNPMQIISNNSNLSWLTNSIDENLIRKFALSIPSTMYSINKVYNSDKYYILGEGGVGEEKLNTTVVRNKRAKKQYQIREQSLAIDLAEISAIFSNLGDGKVFNYDPIEILRIQKEESDNRLNNFIQDCQNLINNIQQQISNLIDDGIEATNTAITNLKKNIKSLQNKLSTANKTQSFSQSGINENAKVAGAIIPIAVSGTMTIISSIAMTILSKFLLVGSAVAIGTSAIKAFVWTATSLVIKMLGATGADICRYLAGGFLKGISGLPSIFESTGLFTGAYGYLMAYAPYIIIGAILTYKYIKNQELLLGNYLYVYGKNYTTGTTAFGSAFLSNFDRKEMIESLLNLGEQVKSRSTRNYDIFRGFALEDNNDEKIAVLIDFNDDNKIYRNKDQIKQLATQEINLPQLAKSFELF